MERCGRNAPKRSNAEGFDGTRTKQLEQLGSANAKSRGRFGWRIEQLLDARLARGPFPIEIALVG
jgi:hypothetical protein